MNEIEKYLFYLKCVKDININNLMNVLIDYIPNPLNIDSEFKTFENRFVHIYNKEIFDYSFDVVDSSIFISITHKEKSVKFELSKELEFVPIVNELYGKYSNNMEDVSVHFIPFTYISVDDVSLLKYSENLKSNIESLSKLTNITPRVIIENLLEIITMKELFTLSYDDLHRNLINSIFYKFYSTLYNSFNYYNVNVIKQDDMEYIYLNSNLQNFHEDIEFDNVDIRLSLINNLNMNEIKLSKVEFFDKFYKNKIMFTNSKEYNKLISYLYKNTQLNNDEMCKDSITKLFNNIHTKINLFLDDILKNKELVEVLIPLTTQLNSSNFNTYIDTSINKAHISNNIYNNSRFNKPIDIYVDKHSDNLYKVKLFDEYDFFVDSNNMKNFNKFVNYVERMVYSYGLKNVKQWVRLLTHIDNNSNVFKDINIEQEYRSINILLLNNKCSMVFKYDILTVYATEFKGLTIQINEFTHTYNFLNDFDTYKEVINEIIYYIE